MGRPSADVVPKNAEVRDGVRHAEPITPANAPRGNHMHVFALNLRDAHVGDMTDLDALDLRLDCSIGGTQECRSSSKFELGRKQDQSSNDRIGQPKAREGVR
jgi:hypothetical protein